jgi:hypothetical protein
MKSLNAAKTGAAVLPQLKVFAARANFWRAINKVSDIHRGGTEDAE